ncbi:helix-turn-helix transcriptional regulator [Undibacterium sp. CY7W]|uniref:Helix-turn-helix transcriptional regulator n=1 Tax=Undibacterium rugosum TaxID=2762291 RepID=A0A923I8R4_9BURK|nr:helix-turn-helix transcriptional regulator [Undibacterium rugosum]MBC3935623.1 helix-turn-helix transcriptional regulator [Undibacterium rugosum]
MDNFQKTIFVKAIGEALSARRVAKGLSQERVAEILGISREAVSRMETGVAVPSIVRIAELANIFECSIEELITKGSSRQLDQGRQLAMLFDGLSHEHRVVILQAIESLITGLSLNKLK